MHGKALWWSKVKIVGSSRGVCGWMLRKCEGDCFNGWAIVWERITFRYEGNWLAVGECLLIILGGLNKDTKARNKTPKWAISTQQRTISTSLDCTNTIHPSIQTVAMTLTTSTPILVVYHLTWETIRESFYCFFFYLSLCHHYSSWKCAKSNWILLINEDSFKLKYTALEF